MSCYRSTNKVTFVHNFLLKFSIWPQFSSFVRNEINKKSLGSCKIHNIDKWSVGIQCLKNRPFHLLYYLLVRLPCCKFTMLRAFSSRSHAIRQTRVETTMILSSFPLNFISSSLQLTRGVHPSSLPASWFSLYPRVSSPVVLFSLRFCYFCYVRSSSRLENSPRLACRYIGCPLVHGSIRSFLSKPLTNSHGSILFLFVAVCGTEAEKPADE